MIFKNIKNGQVANLTSPKLIAEYMAKTSSNEELLPEEIEWEIGTENDLPKEPDFTPDPIEQEKTELEKEADELRKDFDQDYAGLFVPNLEEKKDRYRHINTRLRELNGKKPRILK